VMEAAARDKGAMKILAVTVLTSVGPEDLAEMKLGLDELVLARARGALEAGCDGVIASPLEAAKIKSQLKKLLVVTPGIRAAAGQDDQKRTADAAGAFAAGADYIVVGRPVRDAADPRAAAEAIQKTIAAAFRA